MLTAAPPPADETGSIPVIRLWDFLLVSLQGDLTDAQAESMTAEVLQIIRDEGHRALVVDISGLWLVDSHLCSVIAHLGATANLMGAHTIVAGMRPEVTLTLLAMDVRLEDLHTVLSLEQALEHLGVRPPASANEDKQREESAALMAAAMGAAGVSAPRPDASASEAPVASPAASERGPQR